ncbi:MAG: rRNA maturation RNase YbeY [Candidatus Obscuribacterales bacterium]|nr:rRNA maturation RNase YbeY [Candidatus Obscuribacterales bacterium]
MTSKITILNKQRRFSVDCESFQSSTETLFAGLLANLKKSLPAHLDSEFVDEVSERATLSVALVSNRAIRKLNKEWMGKDKATDVLSFPLMEEAPDEEQPWEMGEIVISVERASEQAADYGHSFEREMAFLFVHGALHILGFDHMTPSDEREMFGRQKKVLEAAGFRR